MKKKAEQRITKSAKSSVLNVLMLLRVYHGTNLYIMVRIQPVRLDAQELRRAYQFILRYVRAMHVSNICIVAVLTRLQIIFQAPPSTIAFSFWSIFNFVYFIASVQLFSVPS